MASDNWKAIQDQVKEDVAGLLDEQADVIEAAFKKAMESFEGAGKFKFPLRITATIEPVGHETNVETTLGFSVSHKCSTEHLLGNTPDMFKKD